MTLLEGRKFKNHCCLFLFGYQWRKLWRVISILYNSWFRQSTGITLSESRHIPIQNQNEISLFKSSNGFQLRLRSSTYLCNVVIVWSWSWREEVRLPLRSKLQTMGKGLRNIATLTHSPSCKTVGKINTQKTSLANPGVGMCFFCRKNYSSIITTLLFRKLVKMGLFKNLFFKLCFKSFPMIFIYLKGSKAHIFLYSLAVPCKLTTFCIWTWMKPKTLGILNCSYWTLCVW